MSTLLWNRQKDQTFETGVDHGVLYLESGKAVSWSGLVSVEDSGKAEVKEFYIDGQKFLSLVSARDWEGSLEAYTYPDEFGELMGLMELGDGLYADSQMPGRFNLSYRTMITAPNLNDTEQHYKIHLVYKVMASMNSVTYSTTTGEFDPTTFQFDLTAVPQRISNARPTAHIVLDTRKISPDTRDSLEEILYGSNDQDPYFPEIGELIDLLSFGNTVIVVDNGDGTWTATGSNKNVYMTDDNFFQIDNVNAEYLSEDIYQFFTTGTVILSVALDDDNIPYFKISQGVTNMGIDTDGVPYYGAGLDAINIKQDVDGVPYFELK